MGALAKELDTKERERGRILSLGVIPEEEKRRYSGEKGGHEPRTNEKRTLLKRGDETAKLKRIKKNPLKNRKKKNVLYTKGTIREIHYRRQFQSRG